MSSWLFIGIPLLLFVILDSFGGLKAGLIGAVIAALIEFIISYTLVGEVDWTSAVTLVLVIGLAGVSLWKNTSLHFKLQPAVVALIFGLFFVGCYVLDLSFLFDMFYKYKKILPPEQKYFLDHPMARPIIQTFSLYSGLMLLIHAVFMVWVALRKSNWFWVLSRAIGTLVALCIGAVLANIHIKIFLTVS